MSENLRFDSYDGVVAKADFVWFMYVMLLAKLRNDLIYGSEIVKLYF